MWYVYVLKSKEGMIYTGMTRNLQQRIESHNSGENTFTSRGTEWVLIYSEKCIDSDKARIREKYFKNNAGKEWLKRRGLL